MQQQGGRCHRIRLVSSSKPVLPIFALFVSMVALGCCLCALFGDYWMKNTTNYTQATSFWLGGQQFDVLDATVHTSAKTMWMSFTYQITFEDQPISTPEVSMNFADMSFLDGPGQSYADAADTITLLMIVSTALTGSVVLNLIIMCVIVIAGRKCPPCFKHFLVLLTLASACVPVGSLIWWALNVANPADLLMIAGQYQVSMTIDGDLGWSAVLPIVGGCGMLLATFCLAIYLPPRPQTPLDEALNYDGNNDYNYAQQYQPLSAQQKYASEDAGDVEGYNG